MTPPGSMDDRTVRGFGEYHVDAMTVLASSNTDRVPVHATDMRAIDAGDLDFLEYDFGPVF